MELWITRKLKFRSKAPLNPLWTSILFWGLSVSACASAPHTFTAKNTLYSEQKADTLTLLSLNLYQRPWQRQERLEGTAKVLAESQADLIFLQEVSHGIGPWSTDPIAFLNRALPSWNSYRGWHEWNLGLYSLGLGTLSRAALDESNSKYEAFRQNDWYNTKGFLLTHHPHSPIGEFWAVNVHFTHFKSHALKQAQFGQLAQTIRLLKESTPNASWVIAGDFNASSSHPALLQFVQEVGALSWENKLDSADLNSGTHHSPYTESCQLESASSRIDHIFLIQAPNGNSTLRFEDADISSHSKAPHLSDHCLLQATLRRESRKTPL